MKSDNEPEHGHDDPEGDRRPLERIVPEIVKRIIEAGLEKISEGPENVRKVMAELKLPKEALGAILSQLDETKSGIYRVVAREVREVLERTNFADELTRALTAVSFEIRTSVRFVPNDAGERPSPEVRHKVSVKKSSPPPPPAGDPSEEGR
ncbi:MAG TPA: hypothetical protein VMS65_15970 [Polyangiaceae bacterium]|nr:hypothetical protein [Polyangiaceae bacterium]